MKRDMWNPRRMSSRFRWYIGITLSGLLLLTVVGFAQVRPRVPQPPESPVGEPTPTEEESPAAEPARLVTHTGRVGEVENNTLTILMDNETEQLEVNVGEDTEILLNGKPARLEDLQPGDGVRVTTHRGTPEVAESVVAARPVVAVDPDMEPRRVPSRERRPERRMQRGVLLDQGGRVWVARLSPGSPAAERGMRPGDTILLVEDDPALTADEFATDELLETGLDSGLMIVPRGTFRDRQGRREARDERRRGERPTPREERLQEGAPRNEIPPGPPVPEAPGREGVR